MLLLCSMQLTPYIVAGLDEGAKSSQCQDEARTWFVAGVRKKVGFQYDLLHDTASAIAVEMVENLSLNTAEAEAIAAMIQHEVSRYNQQQPQ